MSAHPELPKTVIYNQTVVLLTKDSLYSDKPILVRNIPPLNLSGGTANQGRTGNTEVYLDPDRSVAVVTTVVVPVEDVFWEME